MRVAPKRSWEEPSSSKIDAEAERSRICQATVLLSDSGSRQICRRANWIGRGSLCGIIAGLEDGTSRKRMVTGHFTHDRYASLHFFHVLMDELHRHCPLADSRSDALDGARPHVTRCEYPAAGWFRAEKDRRGRFQWGDCARPGPVRTKALASFSISAGSQSVRGVARMKLECTPTSGAFATLRTFC